MVFCCGSLSWPRHWLFFSIVCFSWGHGLQLKMRLSNLFPSSMASDKFSPMQWVELIRESSFKGRDLPSFSHFAHSLQMEYGPSEGYGTCPPREKGNNNPQGEKENNGLRTFIISQQQWALNFHNCSPWLPYDTSCYDSSLTEPSKTQIDPSCNQLPFSFLKMCPSTA